MDATLLQVKRSRGFFSMTEAAPSSSRKAWSKGKLMFKRKRPLINCWKKWFVEESRDRETTSRSMTSFSSTTMGNWSKEITDFDFLNTVLLCSTPSLAWSIFLVEPALFDF